MYRLRLANRAQKDLDRLHGHAWERVRDALICLRGDPRPHGCTKLRGGTDTFRIRVGNYRVLCDVDDGRETITVLRVKHRRDAYRGF